MVDLLIISFLPIYIFIALKSPNKAFLLWVLFSPISNAPLFKLGFLGMGPLAPSLTFDRIAIVVLLLSLILRGKLKRPISSGFNKLERWMIVFILVLTIELIFTYRPKDATRMFLSIFDCFVIPFLGYYFAKILMIEKGAFNKKFFNNFLAIAVVCGFYLALMGIYEGLTLNDLLPGPKSTFSMTHGGGLRLGTGIARVNGPYFTPETFGVVLSILFFIVLYKQNMLNKVRNENTQFRKVGYFLVLVTLLGGIYFNMFRSIWLGLVLGLGCRFLLMPGKRLKMTFITIFALMIIAIGWSGIAVHEVYKDRISQTGTFYNRVGAWLYCLRAFSENPLIGIGYGGIYKYIEHAQEKGDNIYVEGEIASQEPHQTFLKLLAENGILGLIPFLFLLWSVSRYLREYYRRANDHDHFEFSIALVSIFVAYFVPMFFDITGYYHKINNVFYVFIGIAIAKVEHLRSVEKCHELL